MLVRAALGGLDGVQRLIKRRRGRGRRDLDAWAEGGERYIYIERERAGEGTSTSDLSGKMRRWKERANGNVDRRNSIVPSI
jgi:hypothetical protein